MLKKLFFVIAITLLGSHPDLRAALAQSDTPRYEVGAQFSIIHFDDFDPGNEVVKQVFPNLVSSTFNNERWEPGLGLRFTYNLTRMIALEAEANFFPRDKDPTPKFSGGRKTEYLFGPKIGFRSKGFGVFGKVRPGFMRFERFPTIFRIIQSPSTIEVDVTDSGPANFFALDVGGVAEFYASRRIAVRLDLGDTIIHYRKRDEPNNLAPAYTRHNLQFSAGVGFRF
jgi:hypothetical protein